MQTDTQITETAGRDPHFTDRQTWMSYDAEWPVGKEYGPQNISSPCCPLPTIGTKPNGVRERTEAIKWHLWEPWNKGPCVSLHW